MSSLLLPRVSDADAAHSPYHYVPTRTICVMFVCAYALTTLAHIYQAGRYRALFIFPTVVLAGVLEVVGWNARLWSSFSPSLMPPFQLQIIATVIAPTPLIAANFLILEKLIVKLGPEYSRLSPKWYTILFCSADFVALVVQGAGGGKAATADDLEGAEKGARIMLGGIVFQMIMMTVYAVLASEFFFRLFKRRPIGKGYKPVIMSSANKPIFLVRLDKKTKWLVIALLVNSVCLFIRAIYRTVELTDGWTGKIISTEWLFNVFDGVPVVIALLVYNIAHPAALLADEDAAAIMPRRNVKEERYWSFA